ncbi:MAG: dethiobiotin synthase [Reichenbachiella sp.]
MTGKKRYFVSGIDTDSGKTIISAILAQKLKADYWKPVQAGKPTDSDTVRSLVSEQINIHPEGIELKLPMSPHAAAKAENIDLKIEYIKLPQTNNHLIIEGAGGLMVPLNDKELVIDMALHFECEVILVSRNYLGSINHTLLSIEYLKAKGHRIAGIIFNDEPNIETENYILNYSQLPCLGHINKLDNINPESIEEQGIHINLS